MTLEQIKNRQQQVNDILREHVSKSNSLTNTILGSYPEPLDDTEAERYIPNGLLDAITYEQDIAQSLLAQLYSNYEKLFNSTHAPSEAGEAKCSIGRG